MELSSSAITTQFLVPIAYRVGCMVLDALTQPPPIYKYKKLCLLMPLKSGKTTMERLLQSTDRNVQLVDVDELVRIRTAQDPHATLAMKMCDEHRESIGSMVNSEYIHNAIEFVKQSWLPNHSVWEWLTGTGHQHRAIFLLSDIDIAEHAFKKESICVVMPTLELHKEILNHLGSDEERLIATRSYNDFVSKYNKYDKVIYQFSSFQQLKDKLVEQYRLNQRLEISGLN